MDSTRRRRPDTLTGQSALHRGGGALDHPQHAAQAGGQEQELEQDQELEHHARSRRPSRDAMPPLARYPSSQPPPHCLARRT